MDDLALLLDCLRRAGAIALSFHGKNPKQWTKPDHSVVTEADLAVDEFLKITIRKARPDDGWLSEESPDTSERLTKQRIWIADPIDGTRAFADGKRFWGIGIALIENGEAILGGIYCPVDDVMYHGIRSGGAYRNGVKLNSPPGKGHAIVPRSAVSSVEAAGLTTQVSSHWPMLLRFAMIAEGENTATVALANKQDWDLAAGVLLVTETGGIVTTQKGKPLLFNRLEHFQPGLIAAQGNWHGKLLNAVRTL